MTGQLDNGEDQAAAADAPSFSFPLELGKVREFAAATSYPAHALRNSPDPCVPPTFLACARLWQGPEHSALSGDVDYSRLLHGTQEYEFFGRVPRVGETLTGRNQLGQQYQKQGRRGGLMRFIEVVTNYTDHCGELVARATTTMIFTEAAAVSAGTIPAATAAPAAPGADR